MLGARWIGSGVGERTPAVEGFVEDITGRTKARGGARGCRPGQPPCGVSSSRARSGGDSPAGSWSAGSGPAWLRASRDQCRIRVATEVRVAAMGVIAVGRDPSRLDRPPHPVGGAAVARPHAGAQALRDIVRDPQCRGLALEGHDREHRTEDLLAEDPPAVGALEEGGRTWCRPIRRACCRTRWGAWASPIARRGRTCGRSDLERAVARHHRLRHRTGPGVRGGRPRPLEHRVERITFLTCAAAPMRCRGSPAGRARRFGESRGASRPHPGPDALGSQDDRAPAERHPPPGGADAASAHSEPVNESAATACIAKCGRGYDRIRRAGVAVPDWDPVGELPHPLGDRRRTAEPCRIRTSGPGWCTGHLLQDPDLVGAIGLEPTTPTMSRWCSNQLSYAPTDSDDSSTALRLSNRHRNAGATPRTDSGTCGGLLSPAVIARSPGRGPMRTRGCQ